MKPKDLLQVAQRIVDLYPDVEMQKNDAGNLIMFKDGIYIGYVDLWSGELHMFARETQLDQIPHRNDDIKAE